MTFVPWQLDLLGLVGDDIGEGNLRTIRRNFEQLEEWHAPFGGGNPSLQLLALLLGGEHLSGDVTAVTGATGDTAFSHSLGRVPTMVVLSVDGDGLGGVIYGNPAGGNGSSGGNEGAWTRDEIQVRASRTANYQFVVI